MKTTRGLLTWAGLAGLLAAMGAAGAWAQTTRPARTQAEARGPGGAATRAAPRPAARTPAPRPGELPAGLTNAALVKNGGRISIQGLSKDVGFDRNTRPSECIDGNPHTRCVVWGTPVVYRVELIDKLPVTEVAIINDDYATEEAPKDIEIRLPDGTVLTKTLEVLRPSGRERPRQGVKIDKTIDWVEIKVLSNQYGPLPEGAKQAKFGGIGEIEVVTTADLTPLLVVKDYDPKAPAYVEGGSPQSDYSAVKTALPAKIALGQHPGIYLSRDEIVQMREKMKGDPRAKPMMERLISECDKWAAKPIVLPDPNIPGQMRDRGDAQAQAHDLVSKMAGWFGWAYQLSDNEKYAEKAREILVGYARLYPNDYKEHKGVHPSDTSKVFAQRLSEAMWLLPLIQSYDLVYNAKCMTDADRKLIENDLIRTALTFINSKRPAADEVAAKNKANPDWRTAEPAKTRGALGNWVNFYNAAYIQGGVALGDQDWIDVGAASTRHMIANGIGDDGMWKEGTIGYQLFARHALVACLEALARKGLDVYSFQNCRFKNLFDSPLKYAYPDGTGPGIHDSGRASVGGSWEAMAFDFAYLRYGDRNYGKMINDGARQVFQSAGCYFPTVIYEKVPERPLEGFGSLIFKDLGYAILRGEDSGGQTFLLMDYGPHGGGHGHPDKLNLVLFADGDELAGEPQGYRYEDSRHGSWTVATVAHWTLSVDQASQSATEGKLLCFYDAGAIKVMRGQSDGAYPGVVLDRTAVQMPGYIVDVYRAEAAAVRTFDYPLCFRGTLDALKGVDPNSLKPMGSPTQRGYKHILATEPKETAGDWSGVWRRDARAVAGDPNAESDDVRRIHPASEVKATVLGAAGTTVYAGATPGERHEVVLRRKGKETVFAAVIDPYKASDAVKAVEQVKVDGPVPAYGLKVTRTDGGTDLIVVRYDVQSGGKPAAPSSGQGVATNALVTVVRLDASGKVLSMGILGGTEASAGSRKITLEAPGIQFSK